MTRTYKILVLISLFLVTNLSVADDALSLLMDKLKSDTAIQMAYQETRTLELMDEAWHGSGYLYALSPDIMIREQLQPKHLLMGVIGNYMFYFDPENNKRYQDEFDDDSPRTLSIAVFKALVNADKALLHRLYNVDFSSTPTSWLMNLKPKQDEDSTLRITVSGLANQQANMFKITQEEGEFSTFDLQKIADGPAINVLINKLSKTLQGK
jgi:outer membrane lipoprotein-sorting protein